ncbi:pentapeptide repeat-containing protein [Chamaesiphon minutus]|uniref:Putative low-complexity protein n=1 Tax=Chamaesiphon minutus (strain ATCC 27169 / PCC 6605) TaxID=1173020 RepID=K9UCP0_CHAP6|nr:pentapeptide repeat-containing protein [Chamaesiphon minutus]AFY91979.1 putative low-complexity protein [Chamaesiphon minutus PCC 6605]
MNDDLQSWYRALELEPGASLEEVNQAYKDLVLVWHPDRLPQDSARLQEKAHAKLKEINNARDRLREYQATRTDSNGNGDRTHSTSSRSTTGSAKADVTRTEREPTTYRTTQRQHSRRASARPEPSQPARPSTAQPARPSTTQPAKVTETPVYPQSSATKPTNHRHHIKTAQRTPPARPDLSGVDWSGTSLSERDLSGRNLSNANLSNTDLQDSFLHNTNLQGANLQKANLFRANLFQANLSNANLREANLVGADLSGADLSGADLTGARIKIGGRIAVRLIGANLIGAIMPDGQVYN